MSGFWGFFAWLFFVGFFGFNTVLWGGLIFQWMLGSPDLSERSGHKEYIERYYIVGVISGILWTRLILGVGLLDILAGR